MEYIGLLGDVNDGIRMGDMNLYLLNIGFSRWKHQWTIMRIYTVDPCGKSCANGPCSTALFDYQRVIIRDHQPKSQLIDMLLNIN